MIKFYTEKEEPQKPTFGMVEKCQFFVMHGCLCQKISEDSFFIIANNKGEPTGSFGLTFPYPTAPIDKILPKVTKIEFK